MSEVLETYTQEQLDAMSEYEINCAAKEKLLWLRYPDAKSIELDSNQNCYWLERVGFSSYPVEKCCTKPEHYMPIAIEQGIGIMFAEDREYRGQCYCITEANDLNHNPIYHPTRDSSQTGRAVITAFLMMK